jgi:hypothetical protein
VIVKVCPWQIDPLLTDTGDAGTTVTFEIAGEAATQPAALLPVTK